jgi:hypothetical protein
MENSIPVACFVTGEVIPIVIKKSFTWLSSFDNFSPFLTFSENFSAKFTISFAFSIKESISLKASFKVFDSVSSADFTLLTKPVIPAEVVENSFLTFVGFLTFVQLFFFN